MAHDRWAAVRDQYVAFLESTTLADVSEHPYRSHFVPATGTGSTPDE
jgi:DNA-binding IscR family transcriptional regulator